MSTAASGASSGVTHGVAVGGPKDFRRGVRLTVVRFAGGALTYSVLCLLLSATSATAQDDQPPVQLVVRAGRTLRIALDSTVRVRRAGQTIAGALQEPVYAYDRVVLPAGTRITGHIARVEPIGHGARLRAVLGGNFTPSRRVDVQFDRAMLPDGTSVAIAADAADGIEHLVMRLADKPKSRGVVSRARTAIEERAKEQTAVITAPGRMSRLRLALVRALPYHPLLIPKGTVYIARVSAPVDFGSATPLPRAAGETKPAPDSVLRATLMTTIGSKESARGSDVTATLDRPIADDQGRLILPEGTTLSGEVTFARPARHFHRDGQLRMLIERVQAPDRAVEPLLASLHGAEASGTDRLRIDEEGGVTSSASKARFAAPALAALALIGATEGRVDYDTDGAGPHMEYGGPGTGAVGGLIGLGLAGIALNGLGGHYTTVAVTAYGLARSIYSTVFGRGRNISFPAGTAIEVALAPGPGAALPAEEQR